MSLFGKTYTVKIQAWKFVVWALLLVTAGYIDIYRGFCEDWFMSERLTEDEYDKLYFTLQAVTVGGYILWGLFTCYILSGSNMLSMTAFFSMVLWLVCAIMEVNDVRSGKNAVYDKGEVTLFTVCLMICVLLGIWEWKYQRKNLIDDGAKKETANRS